ncbi:hypothetical protein [Rhizobium sp. SL42]|uniref:hypothetical protein n=1 Tax=Rhizobium sp. SL42 TaxID=2806346 RepID=UPI001F3C990E|nr:hypothetical protein [Rhizobium sp. SL42]UJW76919.1 hypothetical protein IM739_17265 [Rhizobium sp. SL42]
MQKFFLEGKSDGVVTACAGRQGRMMTKAISAFLILAMLIQLIKPLGLPGLRRRGDFWKLAVVAFVIWSITLLARDFL